MNTLKILLQFFLIAILPLPLLAQEHYSRVAIAYEVKKLHYENEPSDVPKGLALAYAHGFPLTQKAPLFIEAGAKLSWSHLVKNYRPWADDVVRMDYLDISLPVDLTYRFSLFNDNLRLAPSTGPSFRYNLIARQKISYYGASKDVKTEKINYLARHEAYPAAIFQFGWRVGVAVSHGPLSVGFNFTYDFTPFCEVMCSSYSTKHIGDNLSSTRTLFIGYEF